MELIREEETFLRAIVATTRAQDKINIIKGAKPRQLDALCEIILNVLRGTVPLSDSEKKKASKHKTVLRKLAKRCLKKLPRKRLFIKYFTLIRRVITAALPVIGIVLAAIQTV
jgi:hypothetical protein